MCVCVCVNVQLPELRSDNVAIRLVFSWLVFKDIIPQKSDWLIIKGVFIKNHRDFCNYPMTLIGTQIYRVYACTKIMDD